MAYGVTLFYEHDANPSTKYHSCNELSTNSALSSLASWPAGFPRYRQIYLCDCNIPPFHPGTEWRACNPDAIFSTLDRRKIVDLVCSHRSVALTNTISIQPRQIPSPLPRINFHQLPPPLQLASALQIASKRHYKKQSWIGLYRTSDGTSQSIGLSVSLQDLSV